MVFEIKAYEDIVSDIVTYLTNNNENLTDLNIGSIIRNLVEAYALELESEDLNGLYQQIQEVYNATRISTATGDDLDELASLVGVLRKVGVKSSLNLTLRRNSPAVSNFAVPVSSTFSDQPIGTTQPIRFLTLNQETFQSSIINESKSFKNGIYLYPLVQRFYSTIDNLDGTVSASPFTFTKNTDFQEVKSYSGKLVDVDTLTEVDTAENISGWSNSTDATVVVLDAVNYRQGSNSFSFGKSGTLSDRFYYEHTSVSVFDLTNKQINFKIRIDDNQTLVDLNSIKLRVGEDSLNYFEFTVSATALVVGWNEIFFDPSDATVFGAPLVSNIQYKRIEGVTDNSTILISNTKINFDYLIFSEVVDYEGDIVEWLDTGTNPDDSTNTLTSYVPLSLDVICEAEDVGLSYNAAIDKIVFKVSNLPNITSVNNFEAGTGGEDSETDTELRDRITTASFAIGKATVNSIEQGLLTLDFIASANVDDMPIKQITSENVTYLTGTDLYQLQYEVGQNDSYFRVLGASDSLNGAIDDSVTTIVLSDATNFVSPGFVLIDSEVISFSGTTATDLTGCVRGQQGTIAASHIDTTASNQWYEPDVDVVIDIESKLSFISINKPNNSTVIDVKYQYRWLGHFDAFVTGPTNFTTQQQTDIDDKILEYKAAGIAYTWTTPTNIPVSVTANISLLAGFSFAILQSEIEIAIRDKLLSYDIGEAVYLSQIIETIHSVEGVDYTVLISPVIDVIVAANELVRPGTIILNEI